TGLEEDGIYNPFRDGTRVYVTLPGGRREGFTFRPTLAEGLAGSLLQIWKPRFVPDPGVTSELTVANRTLRAGDDGSVLSDWGSGQPYNPGSSLFAGGTYLLTTSDGLAYAIDGATGDLERVLDANGNTLTFTDDAIISSAGPRVDIERDPQGRISAVVD